MTTRLLLALFAFALQLPAQVVINEVLYRTDPSNADPLRSNQWVELFNKGGDPVDLTGWTISGSDGLNGPSARSLPGILFPGGAYLLINFATGTDDTSFTDNSGDVYTQDAGPVLNPDMDAVALYSPDSIVDFVSWFSNSVSYNPGAAESDAVAASIWTQGTALNSDRVVVLEFERPRAVIPGSSIGRDKDSTDTDSPSDFEPHGGKDAHDSTPHRRNLDVLIKQPLPGPMPGKKKWTVMLYFDADNSLEKYIFDNVKEIEAGGGSDDNVNFVVMYDGRSFTDGTQRGLIRTRTDPNVLALEHAPGEDIEIGERDMGDPNELAGFVTWARATYPADHYALILSAHGDGWKSYGPDETSRGKYDYDYLYMGELRAALTGQHFDLLGFDACLMAGIEVADQVREFTDYYIASEEVIPGPGFPYDTFSVELKANPDWNGKDLGSRIVQLYADRYAMTSDWTLSLIDENQLGALVTEVDTWSKLLRTGAAVFQVRDDPTDNVQVLLKNDRVASQVFADVNFVDLYDLADHINRDPAIPACVKTPIQQILDSIVQQVVVIERHSPDIPIAKGLHIYFPTDRKKLPETVRDYDFPRTRLTDGDSHYAIYASNNDSLPLLARDREDGSPLNARTEWPEPPSPDLLFIQHTSWSRFLERYYHPVSDNHILRGVTPSGMVILPTSSGGGPCMNPTDSISVPVGSTIFFSGRGSSDADQPSGIVPSYYFWDRDDREDCLLGAGCIQPSQVPPGSNAALTATDNMDQDSSNPALAANTPADEKDAVGPTFSRTCDAPGSFNVMLITWDNNNLPGMPFHDTNPNAQYGHPQSDTDPAHVTCTAPPTLFPMNGTMDLTFTVISDPFVSASFIALSTGMVDFTSPPPPTTPSGAIAPRASTPVTITLTGDQPALPSGTGTYDTSTGIWNATILSTGQIAGFSNVEVKWVNMQFGGTNNNTVTGTYQVGTNGNLNGEPQPVTYRVTGTVTRK